MPIGGGSSSNRGNVKTGTLAFCGMAGDPGDNVGDYLECNGQNVSRATYASLFAKWGTVWGAGDGVTTFTLMDARRRAFVGQGGSGSAALGSTVGSTGGTEAAQLLFHVHTIFGGTSNAGAASYATLREDDNTANNSTGSAGSGTASNYFPVLVGGVWVKT